MMMGRNRLRIRIDNHCGICNCSYHPPTNSIRHSIRSCVDFKIHCRRRIFLPIPYPPRTNNNNTNNSSDITTTSPTNNSNLLKTKRANKNEYGTMENKRSQRPHWPNWTCPRTRTMMQLARNRIMVELGRMHVPSPRPNWPTCPRRTNVPRGRRRMTPSTISILSSIRTQIRMTRQRRRRMMLRPRLEYEDSFPIYSLPIDPSPNPIWDRH
mmetsp:Transcript_32497/g.68185  ORF Transcript_32497/g.68185 Transcript_32497/m.68185 type:complete len:211 (+) Transcript_32497:488-1120(+)